MPTAGPAASTTLRITRVIHAPRERVFRAWTDPRQVTRWFGGSPVARASSAESDVRVGGTFRIGFGQDPDREVWHCVGTYVEVVPPERLVYTFGWEGPRLSEIDETLVTVEFRDLGGATEIALTHERNATEEVRAFHLYGWQSSLEQLAELFGGG
jgi:uncharacterized protein YndB with AHSA1/START domain